MSVPSLATILLDAALEDLPKYTGDPSQKITQFIDSIDQLCTFAELTDSNLHLIAVIKLGGAALTWYYNNKESLATWSSLKFHLLERFKPSLLILKTQLKHRKQQPDESLLMYYDDVIYLCNEIDRNIPVHMIVDYLQDGLREELKIHVKRRMKTLTTELTPDIFLKIARSEEELQREISSVHRPTATNTSVASHQSRIRTPNTLNAQSLPSSPYSQLSSSYNPRRSNHRTIDCHFNRSTSNQDHF